MHVMRFQLAWLLLSLTAGQALGQGPVVQLPTYSYFSTGTTVSVPDRGRVYLGGVNRASSGVNEFGVPLLPFRPFRNRSFGYEVSTSGAWVSAYIHDFEAMDEYLLSQPTASRPRAAGVQAPLAARQQPRAVQAEAAASPAISLAELRAEHLRDQQLRDKEAEDFFERGRTAEAAGKVNVARIYYDMAVRRATGELKTEIAARLNLINDPSVVSKVAQARP